MTLLFYDGADAGDAVQKYSAVSGAPAPSASTRYGVGRSLACANNNVYAQKSIPASAQVIVGFAYAHNTNTSASTDWFFLLGDSAATTHLTLRWPSTGVLGVYRGGTLLASSSVTVIEPILANGVWHYIEIAATIADSGGTVVVQIDGVQVINFTGDTKNAGTNSTIDAVRFAQRLGTNDQVFYDDIYIADGLGSAPYNTFLGEVRVYTTVPTGAGASTQWTPSTGANWAAVDELPYSASDFVSTSTSGNRDTYAMADIPATVGTVFAVQTVAIAKKSDAGAVSLKTVDRSGGTNYYGTSTALGISDLSVLGALRTVDPATSAAWTVSGVNALEAGVELA